MKNLQLANRYRNEVLLLMCAGLFFAGFEFAKYQWHSYIFRNGRQINGFITSGNSSNVHVSYKAGGLKYNKVVTNPEAAFSQGDSCTLKYHPAYPSGIVLLKSRRGLNQSLFR